MKENVTLVIFIVLMVTTVVAVDVLFFRHQIWERLIANVGIVLIFIAVYFRFLKH